MRTSVVLVAVVWVGAGSGIAAANSSSGIEESSVIGGEAAAEGEWPDAVALVDLDQPYCTGTLIAADLVLTAAHCVAGGPPPDVRVNTVDGTSGPALAVREVHIHPDWETTYDAALLVLDRPVSGVAPRPLIPDCARAALVDGARVTVAGFGDRGLERNAPTGELYQADLTITGLDCPTSEGCNAAIRPDGELIAAGEIGVDSCYGDSGGPLYLRTGTGDYLAGVVSRATFSATADCGEGGIYVRTDPLAGWIESIAARPLPAGSCDPVESDGGCRAAGGGSGGALFALIALVMCRRRRR
jgi:endonuclease G